MFTTKEIVNVSTSTISTSSANFTDKERLVNLADLSLIGQVADKGFFELFPDCVCSPERVTEVFVQEGLLPKEVAEKSATSGKSLHSPRALESALASGKILPGKLQIGNSQFAESGEIFPVSNSENSPILQEILCQQREVLCWHEMTLDYAVSLYWIRSFNAARKAAEKMRKEQEKQDGISPEPKVSKREKEALKRAEAAERNFQSLQEQGIENMKRITLHTGRVIQAIEEVLSFSTFKKGEKEQYEKAVSHLKGLLPNLETLTSPEKTEKPEK